MSSPEVRIAEVPHTDRPTDCGQLAVVGAVALQQRVGHRQTGLPGQPRRHRLGVDGVEVAAGRQHVDQAAQRRAGRARRRRSRRRGRAGSGRSRRRCRPAAARPRWRRSAAPRRRRRLSVRRVDRAPASQPASSSAATSARACSSAASTAARSSVPSSSRPSACAQAGHASARRRTSGGPAGSPAPGRARPRPCGACAEHVQAVADLDVLDLAQPAVDVQQEVVERRRRRAGPSRPRSWSSFAACISVQICSRIAGSLAGSSAAMLACSSSSCSSRAMSP